MRDFCGENLRVGMAWHLCQPFLYWADQFHNKHSCCHVVGSFRYNFGLPFLVNIVIWLCQFLDLFSYCHFDHVFSPFFKILKPWFPINFAIQLHCYNLSKLLEQVWNLVHLDRIICIYSFRNRNTQEKLEFCFYSLYFDFGPQAQTVTKGL